MTAGASLKINLNNEDPFMPHLTKTFLTTILILTIISCTSHKTYASELLSGDYFQSCNGNHDGDFYEQHLNINNETIKWKFIAFEDESCKTPYLIFLREYKNISDDQSQVTTFFEKASYVSLTDEVTKSLNLIHYCGLSHWQTNVARDVTGLKCDDYQQRQIGEKESFQYHLNMQKLYWNNDEVEYLKQ